MGINSPLGANPSIALGTSDVNLLELTGAYVPFANGGYAVVPFVIQRIRTADGSLLFDRTDSGLGRIPSIESVALMNNMLQATVEMGTGTRAALAGWPAGGKTGTSQNFRDAWFLGYTANLTTGVWVGNDSDAPTKHASGANLPAMIWPSFMTEAHQGVPAAQLPGADLVAYLLGQPAPEANWTFGQVSPEEQGQNEDRMRDWILNRGELPAAAPQRERPGFFRRLFGG